jgi:L-fucose isomerase-like protein
MIRKDEGIQLNHFAVGKKAGRPAKVTKEAIDSNINENGEKPDFTRGTLEGDLADGDITFFRLQSTASGQLRAYIAQGEILPASTNSFGGIGIFAIPEMGRFYRHVLIQKQFPHHGAVAFGHFGKALYSIFQYLDIPDISFNQPKGMLYPSENPFA